MEEESHDASHASSTFGLLWEYELDIKSLILQPWPWRLFPQKTWSGGHPENGNISGNAEAKAKLVEILNPKIMHLTIKKENEGVQGPI